MARIASQSKGGFYSTPMEELSSVLPHLQLSEGEIPFLSIIDPCAGEGEALSLIARNLKGKGAPVQTYGVELEKSRAEKAKLSLDHVIEDGYENIRTEPKFSVMWLNPPYDDVFGERTELRFLRTLTSQTRNVLLPNGLLMFCIPQYVLGACASVLAGRLKKVQVYRFTDENYPIFKQVIVFGYFGRADHSERKETLERLKELSKGGPEVLSTVEEITNSFVIPSAAEPISVFRAGKMNPEELAKDLSESSLFAEAVKRFSAEGNKATLKNPLLPLKPTHAGIAVASGAIGGNFGDHIIVGLTRPITEKEEVYDDDGLLSQEIYTKRHQSIVRVFRSDGIYEMK